MCSTAPSANGGTWLPVALAATVSSHRADELRTTNNQDNCQAANGGGALTHAASRRKQPSLIGDGASAVHFSRPSFDRSEGRATEASSVARPTAGLFGETSEGLQERADPEVTRWACPSD